MRTVASYLARGLLVLVAGVFTAGCASNTSSSPSDIAGTWQFFIVDNGCPEFVGVMDGTDNLGVEVFTVSQSGQNVSASFVDNGGNNCSLSGTYRGDQFLGQLEVAEPGTGGRVVRATVEGYARQFGSDRQVDGWARITFDSEEQCIGEIISFCAEIGGEGDVTPDPDPEPDPDPQFLCGPVELVFLVENDLALGSAAQALCEQRDDMIAELLANNRVQAVDITILGVRKGGTVVGNASTEFDCLDDSVTNLYGTRLPPDGIETINNDSDWGPASTVLADRYPWINGRFRIIIPVIVGGPDNGGFICDAADTAAIEKLASIAVPREVVVAPIVMENILSGTISCANETASNISQATGGAPGRLFDNDFTGNIVSHVFGVCSGRNPPSVNITPNPEPDAPDLTDDQILQQCDMVDIVFLIDTSGSMQDDILLMCGGDFDDFGFGITFNNVPVNLPPIQGALDRVVADLTARGVDVSARILGITEDGADARARLTIENGDLGLDPPPASAFDCIDDDDFVSELLGGTVPVHQSITAEGVLFDNPIDLNFAPSRGQHTYESYAAAAAIVAARFPWRTGALRVIVPVSDEASEKGNGPNSGAPFNDCDDADDQASRNAVLIANENDVIIAGIAAFLFDIGPDSIPNTADDQSGFDPCVTAADGSGEMDKMAAGTGGVVTRSLDLNDIFGDLLSGVTSPTQVIEGLQSLTEPLEEAIFNVVLESCRTAVVGNQDPD